MAKPLVGILQDVQVPQDFIRFESWAEPTKSRQVVYDDVDVRGRSEPHVFYSHTGAQVWSFKLQLVASYDQDDRGVYTTVQEQASFIESLVMPDYGQRPGDLAAIRAPHLARIRILKMVDIVGTIRDPNWTYLAPYDIRTGVPQIIECSFSFHAQREYGKAPLGFSDIRRLTARGQTRFV